MNNYYSAKLQILSLILSEKSQDDYFCSISLTKGIHQFGKIKFYVEKDTDTIYFEEPRIIDFYFPPKMVNRKDILFHLNFLDQQSNDYFGTINISTNRLSDLFSSDYGSLIDEEQEFFQGASLHYKIYIPQKQLYRKQKYSLATEKISKQNPTSEIDSIIGSLFSRPEINPRLKRKQSINQPNKQKPDQQKQKGQSKAKLLSIMDFLVRKKATDQPDAEMQLKDSESQIKDSGSQNASNLMISTILYIKDDNNKKLTLMPSIEDHHGSKKMSMKLKFVIFLLLFGLFSLVTDSLQDRKIDKANYVTEQILIQKHQKKKKKHQKKSKNKHSK